MHREKTVIKILTDLAESWPPNLWLFAANGQLWVMRRDKEGKRVVKYPGGGYDSDYIVEFIRISCDGGDW